MNEVKHRPPTSISEELQLVFMHNGLSPRLPRCILWRLRRPMLVIKDLRHYASIGCRMLGPAFPSDDKVQMAFHKAFCR